jgi:hypothetical protein
MYSRYKLNKVLICPVQYKIILLSLYDLPEILTVSNVSKDLIM